MNTPAGMIQCSRCGTGTYNIVTHWQEWHDGLPKVRDVVYGACDRTVKPSVPIEWHITR